MEMQMEIDDLGFSLSFSCYFSDSLTSTTATAAAKVSREFIQEQTAQFHEFSDVDEEDFEFSQVLDDDEEVSGKHISVQRLPTTAGVDFHFPVGELDSPPSVNIQIQKLFVNGGEASSFSSSSSESEESNDGPSGSFCMWRPRSYDVVSSTITKCKKSSSAGSGSRRWRRILDLLRRSNSEGKESIFFSRSKKIKASKQSRKVSPVEAATRVAGKLKSAGSSPSFHELFYARKRAEKEGDKMKSFLPYRQDLLGFFVNINRIGSKKSTF